MHRWLFAVLVLPGTIVHELSHFIVGLILGGMPSWLSVWPKFDENGSRYGYVEFRNINWFNAAPIGLSPLIIPFGMWNHFATTGDTTVLYFLPWLWWAAVPSLTDWKIASKSLIAYSAIGAGLFILMGLGKI